MFIRGTNIEVGIRRVSVDPEQPYAQCVFRFGKKIWPKGKSKINPIKHVVQKIPFCCLTDKPDFDIRRGTLKQNFKHSTLEYDMPKQEGLFDTPTDPHLYDIFQCGSKFFHIMKGPTKEHILTKEPRKLSIYGLQELTFPFDYYENGVITFNTKPVRKAHISVVRLTHTMASLGKHTAMWPHPTCTDIGYIKGTSIGVSIVIQHDDISLYKLSCNDVKTMWLPNSLVNRGGTTFNNKASALEDLSPIPGIKHVYANGLHLPLRPYARKELVHKGLTHEHIYVVLGNTICLIAKDYITLQPSKEYEYLLQYKFNEALKWRADNQRRRRDMRKRLRPIAVA